LLRLSKRGRKFKIVISEQILMPARLFPADSKQIETTAEIAKAKDEVFVCDGVTQAGVFAFQAHSHHATDDVKECLSQWSRQVRGQIEYIKGEETPCPTPVALPVFSKQFVAEYSIEVNCFEMISQQLFEFPRRVFGEMVGIVCYYLILVHGSQERNAVFTEDPMYFIDELVGLSEMFEHLEADHNLKGGIRKTDRGHFHKQKLNANAFAPLAGNLKGHA